MSLKQTIQDFNLLVNGASMVEASCLNQECGGSARGAMMRERSSLDACY